MAQGSKFNIAIPATVTFVARCWAIALSLGQLIIIAGHTPRRYTFVRFAETGPVIGFRESRLFNRANAGSNSRQPNPPSPGPKSGVRESEGAIELEMREIEMIITPKILKEHGEDKFTNEAVSVRRQVGHALTGNGHVPAFLNKMNIRLMLPWSVFVESKAFAFWQRDGLAAGGRKLYNQRREQAVSAKLAFSQEEAERWGNAGDLDDSTVGVKHEWWMELMQ